MRATMAIVILVAWSSGASAKPLPGGMKVIAKLGRPYIQQGAVTVALRDDDLADYEKIVKAELGPDGKTVVVTASRCASTLPADETKVPLATLQARLDNANGLLSLGKKRYPDAIAKFSSAAQKDPATPIYATNLLAAQVLGKKLDLAAQTLATRGAKNPAWFAWQLATDPQLVGIKDTKYARALAAPTPGTATLAKLGDRDLATSDLAGGMAALTTWSKGVPPAPPAPPAPPVKKGTVAAAADAGVSEPAPAPAPTSIATGTSDLEIVSLSTGQLLARLPIVTLDDACDETDQNPCSDTVVVKINERRRLANALLMSLGFTVQAGALTDVRNGDPVHKDGITVELADEGVTVTSKSGEEKTLPTDNASAWGIAITSKAVVVKLNQRHLYTCDDTSTRTSAAALPL